MPLLGSSAEPAGSERSCHPWPPSARKAAGARVPPRARLARCRSRRRGPASPRRLWRPRFPVSGSGRSWRLPPPERRRLLLRRGPDSLPLQVRRSPGFAEPSPRPSRSGPAACASFARVRGGRSCAYPARLPGGRPPLSHRLRAGAGPLGPRALGLFKAAGLLARAALTGFPRPGRRRSPGPLQAQPRPEA